MKEFYRRHLPHWQPRDAILFVTFRLKNSLRPEVIEALTRERERVQPDHLEEQGYFVKWDANLDHAQFGPRWLAQPEIAEIIKEAMHYRDGKVFDLHAFCIMSNHVHVVLEPLIQSGCPFGTLRSQPNLPTIMHSLKRHTARRANLLLGRDGPFWQDESYDRVIRDREEYARTLHYVLENPVKAGLVSTWEEWQGTYCKPDVF